MNQEINNPSFDNQEEKEEVSFIEILFRYLKYWKLFVLSGVIAVTFVFLYLRYTVPVYEVKSTVILKQMSNRRHLPSGRGEFGLGGMDLLGAVNNIENEIYVMLSKNTVREVVDKLNLHTSYIVQGRIKSTDLYTNSPFIIAMEGVGLDSLKKNIEFLK